MMKALMDMLTGLMLTGLMMMVAASASDLMIALTGAGVTDVLAVVSLSAFQPETAVLSEAAM
jgi:hypothetical protein